MPVLNSFLSFIRKDYYDLDSPDITLYNFHPQFRVVFMVNGIFFNNKDSLRRLIVPGLNSILSLIAIAFEMMFVYRGVMIKDYPFASESFCYLMILGTVPIVYISIIVNRDIILQLLDDMQNDFLYILKLGHTHRKSFIKGQLFILKMCWSWMIFCCFVCILYISNTFALLTYQTLLATQDEYTQRPLIFPMWLPEDDPYRTPNYEIFMFLEILLIYGMLKSFCAYVYMQFHILLHYYNLMDLIIIDFKTLFQGLDETVAKLPKDAPARVQVQLTLNRRLKRIVRWHVAVFKSIKTVSTVYGPPLAYQMTLSSVCICIMAYQVVNQLENGKIDYLFGVLLLATFVQLWIPCYLGTLIGNKASAVSDACWTCGWQETPLGTMVCTDIVLFISRAQRPLLIQLTALPPLTLETYSSVLSTSYTYFNMLRQSTKN